MVRLKHLGIPSPEYRREKADLIEAYKIINNIDHIEKDVLCAGTRVHHLIRGPCKMFCH